MMTSERKLETLNSYKRYLESEESGKKRTTVVTSILIQRTLWTALILKILVSHIKNILKSIRNCTRINRKGEIKL